MSLLSRTRNPYGKGEMQSQYCSFPLTGESEERHREQGPRKNLSPPREEEIDQDPASGPLTNLESAARGVQNGFGSVSN